MCFLKELDKRSSKPKTVPCYHKRCLSYDSFKKKLPILRGPWCFPKSYDFGLFVLGFRTTISAMKILMTSHFMTSKSSFVAVSVTEKYFILFFSVLFVLVMRKNQSAT